MTAYLIEEILPICFLPRGETGLPENCFQSLFHIVVNGVDTGTATATIESAHFLAEGIYGVTSPLTVQHTYFSGFICARKY